MWSIIQRNHLNFIASVVQTSNAFIDVRLHHFEAGLHFPTSRFCPEILLKA
jgi:hypothetical protein